MIEELLLLCKESIYNYRLSLYSKIDNASNERFFIETEKSGKIDITEDIISLASYFNYSAVMSADLDNVYKVYRRWQISLTKYFDASSLQNNSADNIDSLVHSMANKVAYYYEGTNLLGRASKYAIIVPFHAWYTMQFEYGIDIEDILNNTINMVGIYLGVTDRLRHSNGHYFTSPIEQIILEDDLLKKSILSVIYWLAKHNDRIRLKSELEDKITAFIGDSTWEELIENYGGCYTNDYLRYKGLDTKDTDNYLNELDNIATDIRTEHGRLDKKDTIKYDSPYIQTINITMENGLVTGYKDINDIEDKNYKETAIYLINRNIMDTLKLMRDSCYSIISTTIRSKYIESNSRKIVSLRDKDIENLQERIKLKDKQYKKSLNKEKEKAVFLKNKVDKLTKQVKKADIDSLKTLESCIDMLEEENNTLKNDISNFYNIENELLNKISDLESINTKLEEELIETNGKLLDCDAEHDKSMITSREIPIDYLYNAIKHKKILLLGGNKIHNRLKERKYSSIDLLDAGDVNFTMSSMQKYDLVVIYTKLVGHSTIERMEAELRNTNIKVARFNESGVTSLIHFLFNYIHGEDKGSSGTYTV